MTTQLVVTPEMLGGRADAETAFRFIARSGCGSVTLSRLPSEVATAVAEKLAETGHAITIDATGAGKARALDAVYRELIARVKPEQ